MYVIPNTLARGRHPDSECAIITTDEFRHLGVEIVAMTFREYLLILRFVVTKKGP